MMILRRLLVDAGYECALQETILAREITGICADSRLVTAGNVFVALRGLHKDGACFVREALEKGAAFVVAECPVQTEACMIVEDARAALARLCDAWFAHPTSTMRVIGITGTNGKTSTATMLYSILRHAGFSCGLIGTVESRLDERVLSTPVQDALSNMTTPDPIALYALLAQMREGGAQYVVMEVTSHALALSKVLPICFYRGVFTNLSADHLDFHGDMESYFAQKQKLFAACEGAVISCMSAYGQRLADSVDIPLWRVDALTVSQACLNAQKGVSFWLAPEGESGFRVELPIPGSFSVENGALAAMTAYSVGVKKECIQSALAAFRGVRGRLERVGETPFGAHIFLDYAHTPDALEKLLRTVRGFNCDGGRVLLLFGCGGDRDRSKRAEMGRIASRLADLVILTSDNCRSEKPESILRDILRGIDKEKPYRILVDRARAIAFAVEHLQKGDILVLAGKGHEDYEIRGTARLHFSERDILLSCIRRREERERGAY